MKKVILFFLVCLPFLGISQNFKCNYNGEKTPVIPQQQIDEFIISHNNLRVGGVISLPVQVHIVKTSENTQVNESDVVSSFDRLNQVFLPMGIQFSMCNGFHYINDSYWSTLDFIQEINIGWNFNAPGTIDIFYVEDIPGAGGEFVSLTYDKDGYIAIQNDYANGNVLVHEMGHYFSLPHTHDDTYGKEYADGTNCNTAGDFFCDTPADPDLSGKVNGSCIYTGNDLDSKGQTYNPDTKNFMSYSLESCYANFSKQQSDRIGYFMNDQIVGSMDYRCAALPDFFGKIDNNVTSLNRGIVNMVQVIFINFSNVASTTADLEYSIALRDLSGNATSLGTFTKTVKGTPFGRDTFELQITPPGLPDGIYSLEIALDPNNKIPEISDINNLAVQRVALEAEGLAYPDWLMTATGASIVCQGCEYVLSYTMKNIGNNDADQSSIRFYVSEDDQMDANDIVIGPLYYSTTAPGDSWSSDKHLLIPQVLNKKFYVFAAADLDNQVRELSENNNVAMVEVTVTGQQLGTAMVDYVINDPEFPASNVVEAGDGIALSGKFDNIGDLSVSNVAVGIYYSLDNLLDTNDLLVYKMISNMYANTTNKLSLSGFVPWTAVPGTAYMIVKADYANFIPESNENNNTVVFELNVQKPSKPHVFITSATLSNYTWTEKGSYELDATLTNSGVSSAFKTSISVYLTERLLFDQRSFTGTYCEFDQISTPSEIGPNSSEPSSYTGPVSTGYIAPGTYDVAACIQYQDNNNNWNYGDCYILNKEVTYTLEPVLAVDWQETSESKSIVYPVPASEELFILSKADTEDATLFDLNGQKISEAKFSRTTKSLRLEGTAAGIYMLKITNSKGVEMKKVVVK